MIESLTLKPDLAQTVERFEAWWHGQLIDRPPVTLSVNPARPYGGPVSTHPTWRERWLDVEFVVESSIALLEQRDYPADSLPIFWPNLGPEISATPFGCDLFFTETTSWSSPVIHCCDDWSRLLDTPPDFDNRYWRTVEQMTDLAIERCQGRYLVGLTDLHGSYDTLAALRDPMQLCLDLVDCPELVCRAGRHVAESFAPAFERLYTKVSAAGFGATTWLPVIHQGRAYVPSCDFWCMVSAQVARDLIWPAVLVEMAPLERTIFHLDGPQALRHLNLLLDLPSLNAVQWVYGAGNGPAARWLHVYRQIRQAGKSLQLIAQDPADALAVLAQLGPEGVWITVEQPFASLEAADTFVKEVERLMVI
jgi:hypothetical protein